ncbi:kinase-like domain-containing protein [Ochromonadaceae sp. CCMP2298]|nr:kinase-like domain-containing protein [Ochromonadaceae sp. CCMP2298]|mmetsp:Transcript_4804/g.10869  ORF Transcript_4804/g.10869 Transcript_4804/m.10869 type:complete len:638 (+) Transcript_4804:85-1998(+)
MASFRGKAFESHTILIIDKSGSMRNNDVADGSMLSSRNSALFSCLREMFAKQVEEAGPLDVYTLVVFRDLPQVVFQYETLDRAKIFTANEESAAPRSHGNYLPVLEALEKLLKEARSKTPSTTILFMSDGKPSDSTPKGTGDPTSKLTEMIVSRLHKSLQPCTSSAAAGQSVLSLHTLGFGPAADFAVLKGMANLPYGMGTFHLSALDAKALRRTLASFTSSVSESRLASKQIGGPPRPLREVKMLKNFDTFETYVYKEYKALIYDAPTNVEDIGWMKRGDFDVLLATHAFAQGGERNAFRFKFASGAKETQSAEFVAKENKSIEGSHEGELDFHRKKLAAQLIAEKMAVEFNSAIRYICQYTIVFTPCYLCYIPDAGGTGPRYLFVEQYIPGKFVKWNSNSGFVRVSPAKARAPLGGIGAIIEEEDEDEEDGDWDTEFRPLRSNRAQKRCEEVEVEDAPQAFSHWSHERSVSITKEELLICDLQGFFDAPSKRFTLIDPVIHSSGAKDAHKFARTDHGRQGIVNFYASHVCNNLCRGLGLRPNAAYVGAKGGSPIRHVVTQSSVTPSIPTSDYVVNKTKHLQDRQTERKIVTKELKTAVKYGTKTPMQNGRVAHKMGDLTYITGKMGDLGITGWRK